MKITGVAHRTISSTAVPATPSKSDHHFVPFLGIAGERHHAVTDGVARCLVASGRQQNEERGDLNRCQALAVDLGLHQAGGEVVAGIRSPFLGEAHGVVGEFGDHRDDFVGFAGHLVVADTQHHGRPVEDLCLVFFRDAHHVADDLQRQQAGNLGDEVGLAVWMVGDHVRDDRAGPVAHAVFDAGDHLGREGAIDDLAQPKVTRIVKADHRTRELRDLWRHFEERRACRDGAEDVRVTTGMVDVVEPGERPMAGARGKTRNLGDFEEGDRRLTPQRREGAVTQVVVQLPEVERPEVDIGQWYIGRRNAVLATRDTARCIVAVIVGLSVSLSVAPGNGNDRNLGIRRVAIRAALDCLMKKKGQT